MASLEYDQKAFYVRIKDGEVSETEPLSDSVFLDLDASGQLLGMEVVLPKDLPQEMISKISRATSSLARLRYTSLMLKVVETRDVVKFDFGFPVLRGRPCVCARGGLPSARNSPTIILMRSYDPGSNLMSQEKMGKQVERWCCLFL